MPYIRTGKPIIENKWEIPLIVLAILALCATCMALGAWAYSKQNKESKEMKILIKKLHENAVIPHKTYQQDFCYDVTAVSEEEIAPNVWRYGLGFALQILRGWETSAVINQPPQNLSIDLRPRSSVWKTGMVLSNCVGTIDETYTGEISAVFYHVNTSLPRYKVGDRIGQIKVGFTQPMEFIVVQELGSTERGANGYGSTGK